MPATLAPPPNKYRAPLAEAMRAQAKRAVEAPAPHPDVGAPAVRVVCVIAAGAYALDQWLKLLDGAPAHALVLAVLIAAALGGALLAVNRLDRPVARVAATAGALAVALLAALAVAGAPGAALGPRGWGDLLQGISNGVAALPGLTVPYRGSDAWARVVLAAAGVLLFAAAVAAAVWPRRRRPGSRLPALAALAVLYAVPAVELNFEHPWGVGAVFALALVAVMHAERLRPARLPLALAVALAAVLAGLVLAPRLDGRHPIIDVQKLASHLESGHEVRFTWDHRYTPLTWPRDGRVLLHVRARRPAYWKAETLDDFDGLRWVADPRPRGRDQYYTVSAWTQQITVTLGALRSQQFIGAGSTINVSDAPRVPIGETAGGLIAADGPLQSGDAYRAEIYYPTPTEHDMRVAGSHYSRDLARDLAVRLPGRRAPVVFPAWGTAAAPAAGRLLARSPYAGVYALARRLRARARTPYAYVLAVQDRLLRHYTYSESPPVRRYPLAAFLLRDHVGYCQQFSGAMALLLRMGGVPARVATGFSPGVFDPSRHEYVVRDFDAHSWVEVFFPEIGWKTFDPTPAVAPPRSQLDDAGLPSPAGDRPGPTGRDAASAADSGKVSVAVSHTPWWRHWAVLAAAGVLLVAALALALFLRAEARSHPPTAPELRELERALRRTGRDPRPPATLRDLERLLGPDPAASAYLRAVRRIRYAEDAGAGPTFEERRALRRALGDGLGLRGRLRALWAVPPRRRPGRSLH